MLDVGASSNQTLAAATAVDLPQILLTFGMIPLISGVITMILVPFCIRLAFALDIVDRPDERKRHGRIVPYTGGIAMLAGWVSALVWNHNLYADHTRVLAGVLLASIIIGAVGLYDDKYKMPAKSKLFAQIGCALLLWLSGVGTTAAGVLLQAFYIYGTGEWFSILVQGLSLFLVLGVIVAACNAANLIDGLDGLCGGITSILAAGMVVLSVHIMLFWTESGVEDPQLSHLRVALSLALLGATIGFLGYNSPPARIFMGDAGSLFIGLNVGTLMILLCEVNAKWFLGALMLFGLPIADTLLAIARRWRRGEHIFKPDNWHLHHLLIRRGLTVRQAIWVLYLLSFTFALTGMTVIHLRLRYAALVFISFVTNFITMAILLGAFGLSKDGQRVPDKQLTRRGSLGLNIDHAISLNPDEDNEKQPESPSAAATEPARYHPSGQADPPGPTPGPDVPRTA